MIRRRSAAVLYSGNSDEMKSIPHARTSESERVDRPGDAADWRCAICGGESRFLFSKHGVGIRSCGGCGHQFAEVVPDAEHVARTYGDEYFFGGAAGYRDYPSEARLLRAHGHRYARLLASHLHPGRVLDVGAAAGFVLEGLLDGGWAGAAVEPNLRMASMARERLGVPVFVGTIEEFGCTVPFDLVAMIQVVAHLGDLRRALAAAAAVTASHGWWLIETWNRDDWVARLLGRHWHEYNPPSVLHWFNPEGLRRIAGEFGFEQVAIGRPRKHLNAGHAKSLFRFNVAGRRIGALATLADACVSDELAVPWPFTDLFWALFRRS